MCSFLTLCNIYSMVERSIANISDLGTIFTEAQSTEVRYRGYGPTYRTIYNVSPGECATDEPFHVRQQSISKTTPFSLGGLLLHIWDLLTICNFLWSCNHRTIYIYIASHSGSLYEGLNPYYTFKCVI